MGRLAIAMGTAAMLVASSRTAAAQGTWGVLYPSVFVTSDYRYDGLSLTGHEPTVQGSVYWWRPDKFYGGVFASGIDFSDFGDTTTDFEIDIYGGRYFDIGRTRLTLEGMYAIFPDKRVPGPTYNFITMKSRARRAFGALTVGGGASWIPEAPYGAGPAWRAYSEIGYVLTRWLTINAKNVGRAWAHRGSDRAFWDAGATFMLRGAGWNNVAVDLRYSDTNLSFAECGYIDWCEPGVSATLQINFWD